MTPETSTVDTLPELQFQFLGHPPYHGYDFDGCYPGGPCSMGAEERFSDSNASGLLLFRQLVAHQ